ncbi:aspartate aminotransferase family protein [Paremcibacter congregatus]|uniref:aspartate aminotransferase family protein n=1 Tax=Paremcibacter congregatus TaxID=2043170 RepID=UPI0030ECE1ED|tara:strand:+ start:9449 stop:10831 length:1383 start_codon:yes stop_codon:yes gene_type:complete
MMNFNRTTAQWQELDRDHHTHPFSDPKALGEKGTRVITKAEGSYIWDSDDNKILDGMAGLWCVNVGYGRTELIEAADRQMRQLPYYNSFFQTSNPPQIELSRLLSEVTPEGFNHFFFAGSGSEANDTNVRLVRHYWDIKGQPKKKTFISRHNAYHGSTLAATSLGGMGYMHNMGGEGGSLLPGFEHIGQPFWYLEGGDMTPEEFGLMRAQELETKILELGADSVAAFIAEPIQGAGGVIVPPATYWPEIQRICKKYDILLIADEVICGFGRTGNWFGSETMGIKPDLITMAKGLSSGYLPIAAIGMQDDFFAVLNGGGDINHGYTYSGHPVASAVAIANIHYIRDHNLVEKVREDTGPYLHAGLQNLADSHQIVGEVRGRGLMAGIQLVKDKASRTTFSGDEDAGTVCRDHCFSNNLIMRGVGQSMIISPPLTISRIEIDELLAKAKICLDATGRDFGLM